MATKNKNPLTFEASLQQLNVLVEELEHGQLDLEKSLESFEKGVAIIRQCQSVLKTAEQKIQTVVKNDEKE
jgi:exodeoxyribonuclease VII small subunit